MIAFLVETEVFTIRRDFSRIIYRAIWRKIGAKDLVLGLKPSKINGEVSEWFKVQTWNVCVGATPPRVRIPPSPN